MFVRGPKDMKVETVAPRLRDGNQLGPRPLGALERWIQTQTATSRGGVASQA